MEASYDATLKVENINIFNSLVHVVICESTWCISIMMKRMKVKSNHVGMINTNHNLKKIVAN